MSEASKSQGKIQGVVTKLQHAGEKRRSDEGHGGSAGDHLEPQLKKKPLSFGVSLKGSKGSELAKDTLTGSSFSCATSSSSSKPPVGAVALKKPMAPIKMSLGGQKAKTVEASTVTKVKKTSMTVSQAFGEDSDSEEEEMPPEAKMRMRNIGRETPTAAGPNSFGKNKLGFCDRQRQYEKQLEQELDHVSPDT